MYYKLTENMSCIKTLYNRLLTLVNSNKSGIIVLCCNPLEEHARESMAYIHSLGYIYTSNSVEIRYFPIDDKESLNKALREFSNRADEILVHDYKNDEQNLIDSVLKSLLWDMAHEIERDCDNSLWSAPSEIRNFDSFWNFNLGLADTLEEEVRVFLQLLSKSGEFTIGNQTFCASVGSDGERDLWTLYTVSNETFTDDDTGERFPIRRFHPVIMCEKWETLYAKSRAYIFEKFFDK